MNRRNLLKQVAAVTAFPSLSPRAAPQTSRPRLRTSITAYSFRQEFQKKTMQYEDLVRLAAELGVDGLDLTVYWFPSTSDDFLLPLRRLAYRSAVDIYSIATRASMCHPTPELQEAEVTRFKPWLDVAEKLGARHVRVFGGQIPKGASEDQAAEWAAETLKKCAALAAQRGMILGLEDDGKLTETAERLVQIVKQADSPWVGINLDVGNFRTDPYRQIEMCVPYAVNVHFKSEVMEDGKPQPADWDRLLKMFAPAYRGYLSLEYEGKEDARTAVPQLIGKLQRMLLKYVPVA